MSPDRRVYRGGGRLLRVALGLTGLGVVGLVIGVFVDRTRLFAAYLAAYAFAVSIALGALLFLMIVHAMNGGWPVLLRRLTETVVSTLPLLAVLFIPLFFGIHRIYPWAHPEAVSDEARRDVLLAQHSYLNVPFFVARSVLYLVIWVWIGQLLRSYSLERDINARANVGWRLRAISAGGLPIVALTLSFASIDWLMSLTPAWSATMFPVYWFSGGFVAALALLTVMTYESQKHGLLPEVSLSHYYALGRMLLAFVIFWAYAAYFQYFLIWIANRSDEVPFYTERLRGPFRAVSIALVVIRFVVPFFALLSYRLKHRPRQLAAVAGLIVLGHYLDMHWLVIPIVHSTIRYHWLDIAALLAVGGASTAFAVTRLRGQAIIPIHDPALARAIRYESK